MAVVMSLRDVSALSLAFQVCVRVRACVRECVSACIIRKCVAHNAYTCVSPRIYSKENV